MPTLSRWAWGDESAKGVPLPTSSSRWSTKPASTRPPRKCNSISQPRLRSSFTKTCFYEPAVNRTYAEMAAHYDTAIVLAFKARDDPRPVRLEAPIFGRKRASWVEGAFTRRIRQPFRHGQPRPAHRARRVHSLVAPRLASILRFDMPAADSLSTSRISATKRANPAGRGRDNHRNGSYPKTVLTEDGTVDLDVPRDRNGTFDPQIVPKGETRLDGFDDNIISMPPAV